MNKNVIGFSIAGSLMCIFFFIVANLSINNMAGISEIWCIYPIFAVLWWPMSLIAQGRGSYKGFAAISSFLIITFLITTNYVTSSMHPWFMYAAFPVIWWPIALFAGKKAGSMKFAIIGSVLTILYYSTLNVLISSQYPWVIYIIYAILWWPISLYFARRRMFLAYSLVCSSITILFFILVNYISSSHVVWAIYPIFGILWWPLSMYYYYFKKNVTA